MTESPSTEAAGETPVSSSLSAEAAEFVPSGVPLPNDSKPNTGQADAPSWKDNKQRPVTELPSYLTSCYPFVQPNGSVRPPVDRFPLQYRIPGNVPLQRMPIPMPLTSSTWTQPSPLVPPATVMIKRFSHPRQMGGESLSHIHGPPDTHSPADLPTNNGLLPNPHSVPNIQPQAAPKLLINSHTHPDMINPHSHPDMLYPLIRGSDPHSFIRASDSHSLMRPPDLPHSFFHPHQMTKPPPSARMTPTFTSAPRMLGPPPHHPPPVRHPHPHHMSPRPHPHPGQHSRMMAPRFQMPNTGMDMPANSAFSKPSQTPSFGSKSSLTSASSSVAPPTMSAHNNFVSASNNVHSAPQSKDKIHRDVATSRGKPSKISHPPHIHLEESMRPSSPVLISRSVQTDFPHSSALMSLKDLPDGLYKEKQHSKSNVNPENKTQQVDRVWFDKNRLSVGIQISPSRRNIQAADVTSVPKTNCLNSKSISFWQAKTRQQTGQVVESPNGGHSSSLVRTSHASPATSDVYAKSEVSVPTQSEIRASNSSRKSKENIKEAVALDDSDHRKSSHRKNSRKGGTRSPGQTGSSQLNSRSSSSISSVGVRDDDGKIDLHSWTDFPPMNARMSTSHKSPGPLPPGDGAPIEIQRSKDAPPWSLKETAEPEEDEKETVTIRNQGKRFNGDKRNTERSSTFEDVDTEKGQTKDWTTNQHHKQSQIHPGQLHQNVSQPSWPSHYHQQQHQQQFFASNSQQPQSLQPMQLQKNANQTGSSPPGAPVKNYALVTQAGFARPKSATANHPTQTLSSNQDSRANSASVFNSASQKEPTEQQQQQHHQQRSHSPYSFKQQPMTGSSQNQDSYGAHAHPPPPCPLSLEQPKSSHTKDMPSEGSHSRNNSTLRTKQSRNYTSDGENVGNDSKENKDEEQEAGVKSIHRRRRHRVRSKRGRSANKSDVEGISGDDGRSMDRAISSSNVSEMTLHFEDVDEFPDLLSASRCLSQETSHPIVPAERSTLSGTSLSYSDAMKSHPHSRPHSLTGSCVSGDNDEDDGSHIAESKHARKRRKRREQANQAAETELAEISLEQRLLKEGLKKSVGAVPGTISDSLILKEAKKPGAGSGKKSKEPIAFSFAAVLDAMQKKAASPVSPTPSRKSLPKVSKGTGGRESINTLDSSGPVQKRGKERELAKPKKPSPLKKVILKEREEKKRMRLLDGDKDDVMGNSGGVGMLGTESELSQDALSSKSEETEGAEQIEGAELSADLSPISQTSPISMSPASPGNSGVNSPVTGSGRDPVVMKIHSRRFREYCTQILDKEIDQCCTVLLQDLVRFQDRMYHKDPVKAKSKRRLVLGLREVTKHLRLKKIKCVVISPNLEKIQSKGGLDEALNKILTMCQDQNVPFVFALGRRALGRACAKLVPVSVVGIFNFDGCEDKYNTLVSLTETARTTYHEMVAAVEQEVAQHSSSMSWQAASISGVSSLLPAHMGHSRTPSGCSAISFTSSIISEPHSEFNPGYADEQQLSEVTAGKGIGTTNDIDDGNEADTEDFGEAKKKRRLRGGNFVRFGEDDKTTSDSTAGGAGPGSAFGTAGNSTTTNGVMNSSGNNNNSNNNSNSGSTSGTANGTMDVRPHHLHHNLHHHRRQSSVSSLARINEGVDDEVTSKPCDSNKKDVKDEVATDEKMKQPAPVISHIDSIHSPHYKLEGGIIPSTADGQTGWDDGAGNEGTDQIANDEDDDAEDEDEEEGKEDHGHRRGHLRQRSMDKKERIKDWLESQSHI